MAVGVSEEVSMRWRWTEIAYDHGALRNAARHWGDVF
jgi:hypothetical protein